MTSNAETISELEEMLTLEILCAGTFCPTPHECGEPATMALVYFHDCPHPDALKKTLKCFACYQANYIYNIATMADKGLYCVHCKRVWPKGSDINTFMRYAQL